MFTGLVEKRGVLRARSRKSAGFRVAIEADLGELALGESIAVSGACLTVAGLTSAGFEADVSVETHERTTLGSVPVGGHVNLERSLRLGDRLGGHLVTGHVDAVVRVRSVERAGEALRVAVEVSGPLFALIAEKGSVTLDGVSLTVNRLLPEGFEVMLIPHTAAVTTLDGVAAGRVLNLEVDLLARYVARSLDAARSATAAAGDRDLGRLLERAGFGEAALEGVGPEGVGPGSTHSPTSEGAGGGSTESA